MKYVVDIDGTICDKPDGCVDDKNYHNSVPKRDRIALLNNLYDQGNTIVYFTARGMGRHNDDASLATADFGYITELQLKEWGCKYHNLVLGKPSGDYYIDDKAVNSEDFFNSFSKTFW